MTASYTSEESRRASQETADIDEALRLTRRSEHQVEADIKPGWDVFGVAHGGYLAALAGGAVLDVTGQPDIFSITVHYLRKAQLGPMTITVEPVGASRRFTSVRAIATQGDRQVLSVIASVGDRGAFDGPRWSAAPPWNPSEANLLDAGPDVPGLPGVARSMGLRPDMDTMGWVAGNTADRAVIRGVTEVARVDQLTALIACDLTAPAVWNVLGQKGWVPTVELTAHVRGRPAAGPLAIDVSTTQVGDGFLEEDALVHDAEGQLIVQSRQLACWTGA